VGALTVAAACLYCLDSLILLRRFLATTFDLVIFDQGIRGYAHWAAPVSIARGVSDGQGAHFMLLADHWSPVLALLAPLYWIHDRPATLLVAQGVLFALAIPPLWVYTRRRLGAGPAYFVCVAYALSLPVMEAVVFDFHEVAFVPALTAVMVERFDAGKRWHGVLLPGRCCWSRRIWGSSWRASAATCCWPDGGPRNGPGLASWRAGSSRPGRPPTC